jgi:hypothetical protein
MSRTVCSQCMGEVVGHPRFCPHCGARLYPSRGWAAAEMIVAWFFLILAAACGTCSVYVIGMTIAQPGSMQEPMYIIPGAFLLLALAVAGLAISILRRRR